AAVEFFTRAEERGTDPGLVAFNKAAALYRQGQYREAELHYLRCREEATGERLVRVLYDLGNAILQQAQDREARRLEQAISFYEECLRQGAAGTELGEDVRFNLRLARALLVRAKANKDQGNSDNPTDANPNAKDPPNDGRRPGGDLHP